MKSPLRYPGGKSRALEILEYIPENLNTLVSPFFGGGSIEFKVLERGTRVKGFDNFEPLATFWECMLDSPNLVHNYVKKLYPMSKTKFGIYQSIYPTIYEKYSVFERAAIFYALNRASFGGLTFAGGMNKGHPRFTEKGIDSLKQFSAPGLSVGCRDFKETLKMGDFMYLDPPYSINSNIYGKRDGFRMEQHIELANLLYKKKHWVLSYNDVPDILELYDGYEIVRPKWKYGIGKSKLSNEILIIN